MSNEPPVSSKAPEAQKEFSETLARARKFLISSAIILIILIVVVGQELREYQAKQASFVKQIQTTARSEGESVKRLFKEYACIRCERVVRKQKADEHRAEMAEKDRQKNVSNRRSE
jgi:hypothetical protein